MLGVMYLRGMIDGRRDFVRARRLLEAACRARDALGCGALGSWHMLRKQRKKARVMFDKGCKMGDALACESLGGIALGAVRRGATTAARDAKARQAAPYYRRACRLGSASACGMIAALIVDRLANGTPREAFSAYLAACRGGVGPACRQAVDLLSRPIAKHVPSALGLDLRDVSAKLLRRGCALKDRGSCARLGR